MKNIAQISVIVLLLMFGNLALMQHASAAENHSSCKTTSDFLGIPTWYRNLVDENCEVVWPNGGGGDTNGLQKFITIIALNITDMIARVAGVITVGFIIYGGFKYMIAQGESGQIVAAKKTITHAIIGLIIAASSVGIVSLVMGFFIK